MARNDLEIGREYFCRELTSGKNLNGIFRIEKSNINARLHQLDDPFFLKEESILLRLENNCFVTMHDIYKSIGMNYDLTEPKLSSYNCSIGASIAIVGRDEWKEDDPIRRVSFDIAHTNDLLRHSKTFNAMAEAKVGKHPDSTIFKLKVGLMQVSAWYAASGNSDFKRATTIGVRYSLEFDEPVTIRSYLPWVDCIVRFMSAALGHNFVPSKIEVSRVSFENYMKAIEAQTYIGDHVINYIWSETPPPSGSLCVGRAFTHVRDKKELAHFIDCLRVWIERYEAWENSASLMMMAFKMRDVISSERLLTSCKWLEEIPGADSAVVVSAHDIDKIASVAAAEADRLGHGEFKDRVKGVIRGQLKTETNAQRFNRLVASVRKRFGENAFGETIIDDLVQATKFRSKVAHGHFSAANEKQFKHFAKCTFAMEALCYLLTIRDLPMKPAGARRAPGTEIVSNHRLNY
ncbi:hypothetical protein [Sandaracinobacteroides saxicola]|uniref:Uncharacterized protein n=1 Tax=Sandaracinobacteroides saxicola TaxID=2759707 RepID=A0A7G5IH58_9SPHN|nr:hypothetical protein [Sandaracinobacteroides saxicola]QMW22700.1 hypothetical protein H3309_15575 [Sandaracinobacteroides saxicola]